MKKYEHVISLGFFCSTALEMERIGLRDTSSPFDWLITEFDGVIECMDKGFKDFLNYENLYQFKNSNTIFLDSKYNFEFFHDFTRYKTLKEQLPVVKSRYEKRIKRFNDNIKETTLFIRYLKNQNEADYFDENYDYILSVIKKANTENDLLLISNEDVHLKSMSCFKVLKDEGDSVAREFLDKNDKLYDFLTSNIYNSNKREKNLMIYKKKNRDKALQKVPNFIKHKINFHTKKAFFYDKKYDKRGEEILILN